MTDDMAGDTGRVVFDPMSAGPVDMDVDESRHHDCAVVPIGPVQCDEGLYWKRV